jgi:dihydroxy-acid dehydratase
VIGHVAPEAFDNGPISIIQPRDQLRFDLTTGRLDLVGTATQPDMAFDECQRLIDERLAAAPAPAKKYTSGLLGLYTANASPIWQGALMTR